MNTLRQVKVGGTVSVVKLHGEGAVKRRITSACGSFFCCPEKYFTALALCKEESEPLFCVTAPLDLIMYSNKMCIRDSVMCGDNQWVREHGITDKNIIGEVAFRTRKGKTFAVGSRRYRLYVKRWKLLFPVRKYIVKIRGKFGK